MSEFQAEPVKRRCATVNGILKCMVVVGLIAVAVSLTAQFQTMKTFFNHHHDRILLDEEPVLTFNVAGNFTSIIECPEALLSNATWKKKTFCHDFLVNTFHDGIPLCNKKEVTREDQVKCYGSVYTNKFAICVYEYLALRPKQALDMIPNDVTWHKPSAKAINLLSTGDVQCDNSSLQHLKKKTDYDDFQIILTQHLLESEKIPPKACDVWINKTTFFHVSNARHIYFKFNDLYSVHKSLLEFGAKNEDHLVLRIGNLGKDYRFPEFDKALFKGSLTLNDLQEKYNGTVCFRKIVFSPRSYQSIPFRCKMERLLGQRCFECNGRGLYGSPFHSFRTRVLKACNINESSYCNKNPHIMIVSRKPYERWTADDPKNFERILENEGEMVAKIRKAFPNVVIRIVHMEDLDLCEQVRYAVEADVMLGVHGAGLVHFWWLREGATALELEPSYEVGNPSFRMLTMLAGRKYIAEKIKRSHRGAVHVTVDSVLRKLQKLLESNYRHV